MQPQLAPISGMAQKQTSLPSIVCQKQVFASTLMNNTAQKRTLQSAKSGQKPVPPSVEVCRKQHPVSTNSTTLNLISLPAVGQKQHPAPTPISSTALKQTSLPLKVSQKQPPVPASMNGTTQKLSQLPKVCQKPHPAPAPTSSSVQKKNSPSPQVGQKQPSLTPTNSSQLLPYSKHPSSQQFHSYSAPASPSLMAQKQILSLPPKASLKEHTLPVSKNGMERKQIPQPPKINQTQLLSPASTNSKAQKQTSPLPTISQKQLSSIPTNCHQLLPSRKHSNSQQCHSYSSSNTSVGAASLLENFEGTSQTMLEIEAVAMHSGDNENFYDESQSKSEQQFSRLSEESKSNFNLINIYFSKEKQL